MELQELGVAIGRGIVKEVTNYVLIFLVLSLVFGLIRTALGIGSDDSDESKWKRSDMRVLTDHKTGIQYLSDGKGGMVRRGQ